MKVACELRHGTWQEKLSDIEKCNSIITDPPYSPRTHEGFIENASGGDLGYDSIAEESCIEFVEYWTPKVKDWFVLFGDHISAKWWEKSLKDAGLYVFAPVYYVKTNPLPRINGDGPTSSGEVITRAVTKEYLEEMCIDVLHHNQPELFKHEDIQTLTIARPTYKLKAPKSRPGHYLSKRDSNAIVKGQKSIEVMCRIIDDYSEPDDIVIDPFAGSATTLLACKMMGRSSIGTEVREEIFNLASRRVKGEAQMSLI